MPTFIDKLIEQFSGGGAAGIKHARTSLAKKRGSTKPIKVKHKHSVRERRARARINRLNR